MGLPQGGNERLKIEMQSGNESKRFQDTTEGSLGGSNRHLSAGPLFNLMMQQMSSLISQMNQSMIREKPCGLLITAHMLRSAWVAISTYEDAFAFVRVGKSPHVYGPNREILEGAKIMHVVYKTSDICGTVWSMCFMRTSCSMDEYYPIVAMIINRKGSDVNDVSVYALAANDGGIHFLYLYKLES